MMPKTIDNLFYKIKEIKCLKSIILMLLGTLFLLTSACFVHNYIPGLKGPGVEEIMREEHALICLCNSTELVSLNGHSYETVPHWAIWVKPGDYKLRVRYFEKFSYTDFRTYPPKKQTFFISSKDIKELTLTAEPGRTYAISSFSQRAFEISQNPLIFSRMSQFLMDWEVGLQDITSDTTSCCSQLKMGIKKKRHFIGILPRYQGL